MGEKLNLKNKVKSFDELFQSTAAGPNAPGDVMEVDIDSLKPFPNHPFKLYEGPKLDNLVESIEKYGILTPIIIRRDNPYYQILSGHNRSNAARIAGLKKVKAVIMDVDDDTAAIIVVESNFRQRDELLPSEKAFAYKMKMDALKRRGKRTDLCPDENTNKKSRDVFGSEVGDSGVQIQRYLKLVELSPDILQMVDDAVIGFNTGVELSYLKKEEQSNLLEILKEDKIKIKMVQATKLKELSLANKLTVESMVAILHESKPKIPTLKLDVKDLSRFFSPDITSKEMLDTIFKALEKYTNMV